MENESKLVKSIAGLDPRIKKIVVQDMELAVRLLKEKDAKCVVGFRPPQKFFYSQGLPLDLFRNKRIRLDDKINDFYNDLIKVIQKSGTAEEVINLMRRAESFPHEIEYLEISEKLRAYPYRK